MLEGSWLPSHRLNIDTSSPNFFTCKGIMHPAFSHYPGLVISPHRLGNKQGKAEESAVRRLHSGEVGARWHGADLHGSLMRGHFMGSVMDDNRSNTEPHDVLFWYCSEVVSVILMVRCRYIALGELREEEQMTDLQLFPPTPPPLLMTTACRTHLLVVI